MKAAYRLQKVTALQARKLAESLPLRPDMREQFEAAGGDLGDGPAWAFGIGGRLLGLGGLRPVGAAGSSGWLLVGEGVTSRDWAAARRAIRTVLEWAARRAIRRVHAFPEASLAGAMRLLVKLGFEPTGREGDNIIMTKELT